MADDLGTRITSGEPDEPQRPDPGKPVSEPPPLSAIRVDGPKAKGLNKPAIVTAVGGGAAVVLVLASGILNSDPTKRPADTRPMMSDPARPEMARGAVRNLPATYTEAQAFNASAEPATPPPQLGPPLPGDVAAFAPYSTDDYSSPQQGYSRPTPYSETPSADPAQEEAKAADRSTLFFALRETPEQRTAAVQQSPPPDRPPLTALGAAPDDQRQAVTSSDRSLHPGTVIPASLITEINSESAGPVIAQVTQAIYDSYTGRNLVIPQGARLIGDYRSASRYGQSRLAILWSRLIMPDGREVQLDEAATDPSGAAGVSGRVDNHWGDVFGAAALGTLINIGVATTEEPQLTYSGIGVLRDSVDQAISNGIQRTGSIVTNRVVDRSLAIPPTIRIAAGARIYIIASRRIGF